ncbi:MAG: thioredoxin domain-containing protein [Candidatus Micrarchaeota archaeon]
MVLCIIALFVFAAMGIFSAKYRGLAREALDCTIRTATLRPCASNLDERIKATIIAKVLNHSPKAAAFLHKNFQAISTLMVIIFFASTIYSGVSIYNYAVYGNCNGPQGGFCPLDVLTGGNKIPLTAIAPGVGPTLGNGSTTMVEVGCFTCPYTRQAEPAVKEFLLKHPEVKLEFRVMPLPNHENSFISAQSAFCGEEQGKFWPMHDALFSDADHSRPNLAKMAGAIGLDAGKFNSCLDSQASKDRVLSDESAAKAHGVYGTPTFFLNGSMLIGPQTLAKFEDALAGKNVTAGGGGNACPPPQ